MFYQLHNPGGYVYDTVPDYIFQELKDLCILSKQKGIENNNFLIGQIKEEYAIDVNYCSDNIKNYINFHIKEYINAFPEYLNSFSFNRDDSTVYIHKMWCNYQKKGEYNPIHNHTGLFSFVFWIQIPYNIDEERKHESRLKSHKPSAAPFHFHYPGTFGNLQSTELFPQNGDFALFPSSLQHSVQPFFTSDDYRISISGNIFYNAGEMSDSPYTPLAIW